MSDWERLKKTARKLPVKKRARKPLAEHDMPERELTDRIPRSRQAKNAAPPKIKKGNEISGHQMAALKAGTIKIDAKLDLHGLNQRQAHEMLDRFLKKQIARAARLLLVITGKGKNNEGVLRAALPGWVMAGEFRPHILTIHPAHQKHGGDGATYVLLRRQIKEQ